MFFSVNLTHRIAPGQPMMCHDTSYYIMIFPNSSDARWRMAAHQFFKFPRWAWQQAAHVGTLWGLLGDFPKMEKSWARWDMIMSDLSAGLECRFLLQFIDMWAMKNTLFILFTMDFTISSGCRGDGLEGGGPTKEIFFSLGPPSIKVRD